MSCNEPEETLELVAVGMRRRPGGERAIQSLTHAPDSLTHSLTHSLTIDQPSTNL